MQAEFKYRDSTGNVKTGYMTLDDYRLAADHNMRASAIVNARHSDADPTYGSAFEQGMKYLGIFPKDDPKFGVFATRVKDILDGTCTTKLSGYQLAGGGSIVSPKAPIGGSTPASRLFFPEVVLNIVDQYLTADYATEESAMNGMFAFNQSIASEVWTQPVINTTAPRAQDSRPIGQNQMPANMISITASQTSRALGEMSIGLQMSDQAMRDATIDLVGIIVREQSYGQRLRLLWKHLSEVVTGNVDSGETALTPVDFTDYDSSAAAGTITHTGYLQSLWDPERIYNWNMMFGPLSSYLAIENRVGRPLVYDPNTSGVNVGNAGTYGLNPGNPALINFAMSQPRYLVVPDGVVPENQYVMLDTRYALGRVTNVAANWSQTQEMVMQRSTVWRWDWSEYVYRFRDTAIRVIDFSNPS